jgi:hypothetical protein
MEAAIRVEDFVDQWIDAARQREGQLPAGTLLPGQRAAGKGTGPAAAARHAPRCAAPAASP